MYGKKMMATGGLVEQKAKRPNPYDGNEKEADEVEKETESQNFAKGGMAKKMAEGGEASKKGAVMAIVARLAKKPTEMSSELGKAAEGEGSALEKETGGEEASEMGGMEEAKLAAAEELMGALKSGDKRAFASSLENFMKACSYEE